MDDSLAVPRPAVGRCFTMTRRVGLADVSPKGRCRLDGLARLLQDVADEDVIDAGLPSDLGWVVRRTEIAVGRFPAFREEVELSTWASGTGRSWAERRTAVAGAGGDVVQAAATWVQLDPASGRPVRLDDRFLATYGEAAGARRIGARLRHDAPPAAAGEPWPLRFCDFDVMDHVNNAQVWEVVEEHLARSEGLDLSAGVRVGVEHAAAIERGATVEVISATAAGGFDLWLVDGGTTLASARLRAA